MNMQGAVTGHTPRLLPTARGFTIIELMVSLLLGLIVIAGVSSVFLANLRSYQTSEAIGSIQSNARIAFELMARDIRQAGLTGCNSSSPRIANVLNSGPHKNNDKWWAKWSKAVSGYDGGTTDPAVALGTDEGERVSGTDSIGLLGGQGAGLSVATHDASASSMTVNTSGDYLADGDIIIVCDPNHAAILQIATAPVSSTTLGYSAGSGTPGNCSTGLGYPTDCSSTTGNTYTFGLNSRVLKLGAHDWYIGTNPVEGRSLYRISVDSGVATATEMVRNVIDMQITYHEGVSATYKDAADVGSWSNVNAVRIKLTLESAQNNVTTDGYGKELQRSFTFTTTIRNRA